MPRGNEMTDSERGGRDIVQLKLRCRESLRSRIEEKAKENGWSINTEINRRLERSFEYDHFERLDCATDAIERTASIFLDYAEQIRKELGDMKDWKREDFE